MQAFPPFMDVVAEIRATGFSIDGRALLAELESDERRTVWVVAERWEGGVRGIFATKRGALLWRMRDKCREAVEARHIRLIHGNALCGSSLDREPGSDHDYSAKHLRDYGHEYIVYECEVQQ